MRPIKFRVWNKRTNKWIHSPDNEVNLFGETILLGEFMRGVNLDELNDCMALQYTGLKDKNNKEIYEGDIIKFMGRWDEQGNVLPPDYKSYEIFWLMGGLCASMINRPRPYMSFFEHNEILGIGHTDSEIIGNIFDNPELMK